MSEGSNRETLGTVPINLSLISNVEWWERREGELEQYSKECRRVSHNVR